MSYPTKLKGYRRITVDGVPYRWRFDTDTHHSMVTLQGGICSGQQVAVIFTDVPDWWLSFPEVNSRHVSITPRYVAPLSALPWFEGGLLQCIVSH